MFQPFGEESSTLLLIFYLFLGFCGFFLLILLLSMICIALSEDDQILVTIDTDDEEDSNACEKYEVEKYVDNGDKSIKVVKQCEQTQNYVVMKGQQMIIRFCELFKNSFNFQFYYISILYSGHCKLMMILLGLNNKFHLENKIIYRTSLREPFLDSLLQSAP